jgi:hypothetical protein
MKYFQLLVAVTLLFVNFFSSASAREVTLYWEPSPSPDVIGYKVYYQQQMTQLPLFYQQQMTQLPSLGRGGAEQGASPIDVKNTLTATISGLDEDVVYYFSVTAYDSYNNESTYSNIVNTTWMPPLLFPADKMIVYLPATFSWGAGPAGENLNYTLYYGTDKTQIIYAGLTPPNDDSPTIMNVIPPTRIDIGSRTSFRADDLEPGKTYYWKVDAKSIYYPATVYHSQVFSFDTPPELPDNIGGGSALPGQKQTMFFQQIIEGWAGHP